MLSVIATLSYVLTVFAACACAYIASRRDERAGSGLHWVGVAAFFAGMGAMRFYGLEDVFRESLRSTAMMEGLYEARRMAQAPVVAAIVLIGGALAFLAWRSYPGMQRRRAFGIWLSRMAVLGFVPLMALRLVSFHATDVLLYSGPVRLNWLLDGGLTLAAIAGALLYARARE